MNEMRDVMPCASGQSSVRSSVRQSPASFRDATNEAYAQITDRPWLPTEMGLVQSIAKIMAEVYLMPDSAAITVGGETIPAPIVKEVYREIEQAHVVSVIEAFREQREEIRAIKAYLRSMLYNAVFEFDFEIENEIRAGSII